MIVWIPIALEHFVNITTIAHGVVVPTLVSAMKRVAFVHALNPTLAQIAPKSQSVRRTLTVKSTMEAGVPVISALEHAVVVGLGSSQVKDVSPTAGSMGVVTTGAGAIHMER